LADSLTVKQFDSLAGVDPAAWNSLTDHSNPFVRHEYLYGLEQHDCLDAHGWLPCHIGVFAGEKLVGAMPLYARSNSYGEFVFDWAWADAYERAGGRYYPKLVTAIPFAPVIGPRLLAGPGNPRAGTIRDRLLDKVLELIAATGVSSFHSLFTDVADHAAFTRKGLMQRLTCQFHWRNRGYRDFQDFLDSLTSKRRKEIRRERRQVLDSRIDIEVLRGDEINEEQWQAFYRFYCSTFHRRWGNPRLTLDFFRSLSHALPEHTLLVLASQGRKYVAGAISMVGSDTVYGRHWGCSEHYPFLHFELCYYQTIEFCIEHGLKNVDAGVQGEHKLSRGFEPVAASSFHWIRHTGFREAVQDYLQREEREMTAYLAGLSDHLPYRSTT
jgi:predicted N-acyltransferase